jgi:hypothetical protein
MGFLNQECAFALESMLRAQMSKILFSTASVRIDKTQSEHNESGVHLLADFGGTSASLISRITSYELI